jgi:hypothetical protein
VKTFVQAMAVRGLFVLSRSLVDIVLQVQYVRVLPIQGLFAQVMLFVDTIVLAVSSVEKRVVEIADL